jgi:hypothetical protein
MTMQDSWKKPNGIEFLIFVWNSKIQLNNYPQLVDNIVRKGRGEIASTAMEGSERGENCDASFQSWGSRSHRENSHGTPPGRNLSAQRVVRGTALASSGDIHGGCHRVPGALKSGSRRVIVL